MSYRRGVDDNIVQQQRLRNDSRSSALNKEVPRKIW